MHNGSGSGLDLVALFSQAQALTKRDDLILPHSFRNAALLIAHPAVARGGSAAALYAQIAAADMRLPERFEGVKARFVEATQGIFLQPVADYNEKDPDCYRVRWSKDGKRIAIDLAAALVWHKWETPAGYLRRAPVYLQRGLPNSGGSVLYVDLKNSTVKARRRAAKKRAAAPAAEAAAAQQ